MAENTDVWQDTLPLMALKTLHTMAPLHGYGIACRIEQISGNRVSVKYGTLYPALLKLEQEGYISAAWGVSDNNRRAKYYSLRSEEHTSELQSRSDLVCRLLLEKKKTLYNVTLSTKMTLDHTYINRMTLHL